MQKLFLRCVGVKVALLAIFALSAGASELQDIMKARPKRILRKTR